MSEVLKKSSKTEDRFTAISDLQNNLERVLFRAGRNSTFHAFQEFFTEKQQYPCPLLEYSRYLGTINLLWKLQLSCLFPA